MGNAEVMDMMVGALTDPFDTVHMGITAENVAAKWGISRQQQDEMAVESNKRAINAIEKGYFKEQILPIELEGQEGPPSSSTRRASARGREHGRHGQAAHRVSRRTVRSPPATPAASMTAHPPSC